MSRVFSNSPVAKDFVSAPFVEMIHQTTKMWLAAPFVTMTKHLVDALADGKSLFLIVGLNLSTSPQALMALHGKPNCQIRYFTSRRFHAKIYIFDKVALLGSSNLTEAGFERNREATIFLEDASDYDELRSLFEDLWKSAKVLTDDKLAAFVKVMEGVKQSEFWDRKIADAVGPAAPENVAVSSQTQSKESLFLEDLRRELAEYRDSFREVTDVLQTNGFRRPELEHAGIANETNRFLNWVRQTYGTSEKWKEVATKASQSRRAEITALGREWQSTSKAEIPDDYVDWLKNVQKVFGTRESLESATKEQLTQGLLSLHAFNERYRFTGGGVVNLPDAFWSKNHNDVARVKKTFQYLLFGAGSFEQRFHDILYEADYKLASIGYFSALELFGTIRPDIAPPVNGRMAKALRYLGYDVKGG